MKMHFLILCLFPVNLFAQSLFQHAKELDSLLSNDGVQVTLPNIRPGTDCSSDTVPGCKIASILQLYSDSNFAFYPDVMKYYRDNNPFLSAYIVEPTDASVVGITASDIGTAIEGIGQTDVTNFAFGLTDFLIDRTKTELNTAFFKRLNKFIVNDSLQLLLPNTVGILSVIGNDIYQYDLYIQNLRTAFQKDLSNLLTNTPKYLKTKKDVLDSQSKFVYPYSILALNTAENIKSGMHPGDVLHSLSNNRQIDDIIDIDGTAARNINVLNAIRTVDLISQSLRNDDVDTSYWIEMSELEEFKKNSFLRIYLGLVYQECQRRPYDQISFNGTSLKTNLDSLAANWDRAAAQIDSIRNYIQEVYMKAQHIDSSIKGHKAVKKLIEDQSITETSERNKLLFDGYYNVYSASLELLNEVSNISSLPYVNFSIPTDSLNILSYLEQTGEIAVHISNQQYFGAVTHTAILFQTINMDSKNEIKELESITAGLIKYGSFMAGMVEAQSPEEAKEVIETAALPPGSYSIKRHSVFSVSLNGYLGVFAGWERISGVDKGGIIQGGIPGINTSGLSAPIGIAISVGFPHNWKNPWSATAFFSVIDLGTLASYRFNSDSTIAEVPTIQLKDIIAPGIFGEIGIGGTPLSLGAGWQYGPVLREITGGTTVVGPTYSRFIVSLKVDVPIFNFYAVPLLNHS